MKESVVILYSKDMYDQAALSLKEFFAREYNNADVILIEESSFTNFYTSKIHRWAYKFSTSNMPIINRLASFISNMKDARSEEKKKKNAYSKKNNTKNIEKDNTAEDSKIKEFIDNNFRKTDNIITRFNPAIIVCMSPRSLSYAIDSRERLGYKSKVFACITDYALNKGFVIEGVDCYFVQNGLLKQNLINLGIKDEEIAVLGTPILDSKKTVYDKDVVMDELGIENKNLPVALIICGRFGSGRIKSAFKDLAEYYNQMNLIILTNGSENLKSFVNIYSKSLKIDKNVYCVDAINDISKLYSIANVVISAPTAYITYEAISRGIPCVVLKGISYIEDANLSYLTMNKLALIGDSTKNLIDSTLSAINLDSNCVSIMENASKYFIQNAVEYYANALISVIEQVQYEREIEQNVNQENENIEDEVIVTEPVDEKKSKKTKKGKK